MGHYAQSLLFLLGWNLLCCDATASVSLINSANGLDTLECGSDGGIVSCRINPYAGLINWEINGIPFATCAPGCSENPIFTRNYSPTYDVVNGIFNLTVDGATFDDDSTTFKCDDGVSFDSITIEVVPAYSDNKTNINTTDEGKQVECTTACVQHGVEFEWFTVKTNNSDRKAYNNGQTEMTEDTTECSLNLACGGVGTGKFSSKIMIPTVADGEERYLEVVVKYKSPDEERTFRFDEKFHFKDESMVTDGGLAIWIVVVIVIACLVVIGIPLAVACVIWRKDKELPCDSCQKVLKGRKQCIYCNEFLCTECKQKHLQTHEAIRTNHQNGQALNKLPCDSCQIEKKGRTKCIYCNEFLCKKCTKEHLQRHNAEITDHENGTNNENEPKLPCDLCKQSNKNTEGKERCSKCHDFLCDTCTREHRENHKAIISNYKNDQALKNRFTCSHTENNVEFYCLKCQQYLCKWCITYHSEHRILRHCQPETRDAGYQIFCKFCQNISIKEEARHYSKCDGSFFCEDGRTEKKLGDIIAVHGYVWTCKLCEDNPFHCRKMDGNYVCAACFLVYIEQTTEDTITHANICALHPALNGNDVNKLKADVFCLVCNEYLCKNCFKQHLDLKWLWINKFLTNKATNP